MLSILKSLFLVAPIVCLPLISAAAENDEVLGLSLEQLLAVKVTGASKYEQKQSEVAASVYVITRDEIRDFGWRTIDDALASLPGLYSTIDRQYNYFGTRGFSVPGDFNTRVLVLIDGNRFNDPVYDGGPFGLEFPLDLDLIERIEFIPGPGGAVYGQNAMFGVVNVITRTGATVDGTEVAGAYEELQNQRTGRATWGKLFENGIDVLLSTTNTSASGQELFLPFPGSGVPPSEVPAQLSSSRDRTFFGRIARGPWSFEYVYGNVFNNDPTGAYRSDPLVSGQFQQDIFELTQLQYQDSFANNTLHVLGRLFTGKYRYYSILSYDTLFSFPVVGDWYGGELRLLSTAFKDHKLMVGLEAQRNVHADQFIFDLANPTNNIDILNSNDRVGIYAQDEWRITDTVSSTLGLRADHNYITGTKLSPRAALIWQATPATTMKILYGRAHRAPNVYEYLYADNVAQIGNPSLKGETVNTMELVVDHLVAPDLTLHGSIYQWIFYGLVTLGTDPVSGLAQYQNGGRVDAHGVELAADKTWKWGARLRGSVSYQDTHSSDNPIVPNSPHFMSKLNFSSPVFSTGLRVGYELQYYSPRQTITGNSLGGYGLSNINFVADKWMKGLEVALGVYNLFDHRYQQTGSRLNWQDSLVQDGTNVRLKVDYRF